MSATYDPQVEITCPKCKHKFPDPTQPEKYPDDLSASELYSSDGSQASADSFVVSDKEEDDSR
ncbi:hypothetical protein ABK046_53335, partial [Streptomyces caeruleatus]